MLNCFYNSNTSMLFTFTLLLQLHLLLSLGENHYGKCLRVKCGNLTIGFPFYIFNQQENYCGLTGFEVYCKDNNSTLFNISGDAYIIRNILYEREEFQIINSALVGTACFNSVKNLSLVGNNRLSFAMDQDDILLFTNCSDKVVEENKDKEVKCKSLAAYKNDSKVNDMEAECIGQVTAVPYYEEGYTTSVVSVLRRGILLKWDAYDCMMCEKSGGQCAFDAVQNQFNCYCLDRIHALHCVPTAKKRKWMLILALGIGGGMFLLLILVIIALRYHKNLKFGHSTHKVLGTKGIGMNQNIEAFLERYGSLAPKRYTYAAIRKMTNNFKDIVGEGGYGVVYKGRLNDNRLVAVKNLKKLKGNGQDFINEVVSIGRTNHVNIVTLIGFCHEANKRALVYEFLPNGSLEKFMRSPTSGHSLPMQTLFSIAVGIGKGLDYLHRGCNMRILHFDIKPHNILLDEELCPKISDFGLARLCSTKDSIISLSEARGTIGYIAPEVFLRNYGGVSHKSDVYSYGMMLIDLVCGRKNVVADAQCSSELYFPEWIYNQLAELESEVESPEIVNDEAKSLGRKMVLVGLWCIQTYPANRPPMNRVLEMLEGPLEALQVPPKQVLSSHPNSVFISSETSLLTSG